MASSVASISVDHSSWGAGGGGTARNLKSFDRVRSRVTFESDGRNESTHHLSQASIEPDSPTTARGRTKVLDRWAAHQAREMIATIERQAHEAELSALTATSAPVLARAASLLRETPPPPAPPTTCSSAAAADEIPTNVRASSLIQMWRELEAEAGMQTPTSRGHGTERSESFEVCDESGWDSDLTGQSEPRSSLSESERDHVVEAAARRAGSGAEQAAGRRNQPHAASLERSNSGYLEGVHPRIRGRREMQELLERFESDRRRELGKLAEQRSVSGFPHRRRIQTFLRFRSLRREVVVQDHQRPHSTVQELDQLHRGITILFLKERFSPERKEERSAAPAFQKSDSFHTLFCNTPPNPEREFSGHLQSAGERKQEATRLDVIDEQPEEASLPCGSEDLQEEDSQSSEDHWGDGSSQKSNPVWEIPMEPSNRGSAREEEAQALSGEPEQDEPGLADGAWSVCPSHSYGDRDSRREANYNGLLETYSDNDELRDLLERRTVTASLAGDFRDRLDRLILASLKRRQASEDGEECEDHSSDGGHSHGTRGDYDQLASSFSLMPLPAEPVQPFDGLQPATFEYDQFPQMDLIHDMRSDIASIHHEMGSLRKFVESCMETQASFRYSVEQDVSTVIRYSVGTGNASDSSKWEPAKKGHCCICYEKQIDSLLYRCGHMCTCFRCANELQWNNGRCPVCRAPIVDVVRAYSQS